MELDKLETAVKALLAVERRCIINTIALAN